MWPGPHDTRDLLSLQIYQSWLDKSTPYTAMRWVVTLGLSFVYMVRVYLLQVGVAVWGAVVPTPPKAKALLMSLAPLGWGRAVQKRCLISVRHRM